MKKFLIILLIAIFIVAFRIRELDIMTGTTTIASGSSATLSGNVFLLDADSCAFQLEVSKTDVSATVTYQYLTKNNNWSTNDLGSFPVNLTLDSGTTGAFGSLIPSDGGKSRIRPYIILDNKGITQAISYNLVLIKKTQ